MKNDIKKVVKKTVKKTTKKDVKLVLPFAVEEIVASCSKDIKYYKEENKTLWAFVAVLTLLVIGEYIVFFLK